MAIFIQLKYSYRGNSGGPFNDIEVSNYDLNEAKGVPDHCSGIPGWLIGCLQSRLKKNLYQNFLVLLGGILDIICVNSIYLQLKRYYSVHIG